MFCIIERIFPNNISSIKASSLEKLKNKIRSHAFLKGAIPPGFDEVKLAVKAMNQPDHVNSNSSQRANKRFETVKIPKIQKTTKFGPKKFPRINDYWAFHMKGKSQVIDFLYFCLFRSDWGTKI